MFSDEVRLFVLVTMAIILTAVLGYVLLDIYDQRIQVLRLKKPKDRPPAQSQYDYSFDEKTRIFSL